MNKITKIIIGIVVVVLVVLFGSGKFSASKNSVTKEPVKIGATLALTGNLSYLGEAERNGLVLAAEEINANGGISGRPIKLIVEDNQGDAKNAVTNVNKMISLDKADVLVSAFSHITNAIKTIAADNNKVMLYIASIREVAQENKLFFRDYWDAGDHGKALADLVNSKGYKSVNYLTEISGAATSFEKAFNDEAEKFGIKIVHKESFDPNATDLLTPLTKIKASKADALVVVAWRQESILMSQLKGLGMINVPTIHLVAPFISASDTQEMRDLFSENKSLSTWYGPIDRSAEKSVAFVKKYVARFGAEPRADSFYSYDDMFVMAAAIKNCLSDKTTAIDSQCIANELLKTNYDGAAGKLSFDKDGLSTRDTVTIVAKDGKWEDFSIEK